MTESKRRHTVEENRNDKVQGNGVLVSGRRLTVNGTSRVPIGLFGVHAAAGNTEAYRDWGVECVRRIFPIPPDTPKQADLAEPAVAELSMYIECFFDRYQPAYNVTRPKDWKKPLQKLARGYAEAAAESGTRYLEFWNEPFLNWAIKPGVNYDPKFYDPFNINPGDRVRLRGSQDFTEHLVWSRESRIVSDHDLKERYHAAEHSPADLEIGGKFVWNNRRFRKVERWVPLDPTQRGPYSGQQNRIFYERMLRVFAEQLKYEGADIKLIGGWGFHLQLDNWEAWRQLYQPLLEGHQDILDGVGEHHYGDDTRIVAAAYETATAFMDQTCGKRLPLFNTEAGGMLDLKDPNRARPEPCGDPVDAAQSCMLYTLRDIIHVIDICPDKAMSRCAHRPHENGGDELAFRLLKPLRGELVYCSSEEPDIWCVASRQKNQTVTVVLFNNAITSRQFRLNLELSKVRHRVQGRRICARRDNQRLHLVEQSVELGPANEVQMEPLEAITWVIEDWPEPARAETISIEQYFAEGILNAVTPDVPLNLTVSLPAERLRPATAARVKFVVEDCGTGNSVLVNGNPHPIPAGDRTLRLPVAPAELSDITRLRFTASTTPYQVWMASIELFFSAHARK